MKSSEIALLLRAIGFGTAMLLAPQVFAGNTVIYPQGIDISLKVTTPGFTDRYARHQNGLGVTSVINASSSDLDKQDSSFMLDGGLADPSCYSLESKNYPGQYLRHQNGRIKKQARDGTLLFDQDATFCSRPGLSGTGVSFQPLMFPADYLRHQNAELWITGDTGGSFKQDASWAVMSAWGGGTPAIVAPTPPLAAPPAANSRCTDSTGLNYVEAYRSATVRWCVEPRVWASNAADIANFYAYSETIIPTLGNLFGVTLPGPFVFQVDYPNGGAHTGSNFGTGVSVTGDAFYGGYPDPVTGQNVPGFWGYLLTLHEAINDWTGAVSGGWPTDWWADHRSPFPNSMDFHIMQAIGDQQNNATLKAAAETQHYRFGVVGQGGYDEQVAMDDNFYDNYGGFGAFARTFKIMKTDGVKWDQVAPNPSVLLSEYVIAYLQMGFYTRTDLTQSDFIAAGVSKLDPATPAYMPDRNHVKAIADAHCSIVGAQTDPGVTTSTINSALNNLRHGVYGGAQVTSRSCTQAPAGSIPRECACDPGTGHWTALWN